MGGGEPSEPDPTPFSPIAAVSEPGFYSAVRLDTAFKDAARTIPVTVGGDQIFGVTDLSSYGNHATTGTAGPIWRTTPPKAEWSVTLNRLNTELVPGADMTLAARFRRATSRTTGTRTLIGSANGTARCWLSLTGNVVSAGVGNVGSDAFQDDGATNLADSAWHTAALTFNISTIRLYLDGVQVNSVAFAGSVSGQTLSVGARRTAASTWDNHWLDDISHWFATRRVLSADDVAALHASMMA